MPARRPDAPASPQLDLFATPSVPPPPGPPEPRVRALVTQADHDLAARVPAHVRFGTSSWTFPGWGGIVYEGRPSERDLQADGLAAYAHHPLFRTVGIDRSYYAPLGVAELGRYARALPPGFRCVQKVWSAITTLADHRTGELVPTFLDSKAFDDAVVAPNVEAFAEHVGALVLELAPVRGAGVPSAAAFAHRLDAFLGRASRALPLAVELRHRPWLTARYLDVLRAHGVAHVLNLWERMPDVGEQLALPGVVTADFVVARLLIRPGRRYEDEKARFAPFDRIVEPDEKTRRDVVDLVQACEALGKVVYVIVNNKVEGSSPLTVRALAERVASASLDDVPLATPR